MLVVVDLGETGEIRYAPNDCVAVRAGYIAYRGPGGLKVSAIICDGDPVHPHVVVTSSTLVNLHDVTEPIPGRPGYRIDSDGREWFSSAWL